MLEQERSAAGMSGDDAMSRDLAQRLKDSTLTPGEYTTSEAMRSYKHVAIYAGKEAMLVMVVGPAEDKDSHEVANRLISNDAFKAIAGNYAPDAKAHLGVGIYADGLAGTRFPEQMTALVSKPSGQVEHGGEDGPLVAAIPGTGQRDKAFAVALATSVSVERCFDASLTLNYQLNKEGGKAMANNDREHSTSTDTSKQEPAKKQLGEYRMPHSDIPPHFKEIAQRKLQQDEVTLHPARDQGGYKGKVIHADSNFVVQSVGAKGNSAVVHRAGDLNYVSNNLDWRAKNGRLGSQNVQIHYDAKGKGSVYPFDPEKAAAAKTAKLEGNVEAARKTEQAERGKNPDSPAASAAKEDRKSAESAAMRNDRANEAKAKSAGKAEPSAKAEPKAKAKPDADKADQAGKAVRTRSPRRESSAPER